jgi:hypothetical protein
MIAGSTLFVLARVVVGGGFKLNKVWDEGKVASMDGGI